MGKVKEISMFCRQFRILVLKKTLTNFCKEHDVNIKNLSAFEHGRANNIDYLLLYLLESYNINMSETFIKVIVDIMKVGNEDGKEH